ncbi:hypothetical protein Afil01_61060 [Actinorhabdospora filicis]|uniref:Membrane protein insertion efficiency factor YidD n=1 Tax=Actinorhabdospora filicis TaxID=1785913 RepID=A0A9W6SQX3_9ACTN|nr:membrane protein insertion efficiency factor YidD [Actinorhabdospora filicis]GLZ81299.1 hypothetical protein Afil01_61060 [Actinorhabdospora filicis]
MMKRGWRLGLAIGAPLAAVAAMITAWLLWLRPRRVDVGGGGPDTGESGGDIGTPAAQGGAENPAPEPGKGGGCDLDLNACADDACDEQTCDNTSCGEYGCHIEGCSGGTAIAVPLSLAARFGGSGPMAARLGRSAITLYRRWSRRTRPRCRYVPTCSAYGLAVVERHGLATGARLALARVRRCTRDVPRGTQDPPP